MCKYINMLQFVYPIIASILLGAVSLVGATLLPINHVKRYLPVLISLAAGAIIGDVFLHIIPHIVEENLENFDPNIFIFVIFGIVIFYLLETALHWHHNHSGKDISRPHAIGVTALVADSLHNLFDGIGITLAFALSPVVGISTTIAFMLHEIPQEIGDFAIYINSGWSRKKAILLNLFSGLTAVLGSIIALVSLSLFETVEQPILMTLSGGLIYIALADLIPESNNLDQPTRHHKKFDFSVFLAFIFGVCLTLLMKLIEGYLGI
jgi:zinc and cadmium transporter